MRFAEEVAHEKPCGGLRVWARMALGKARKALQTGSSLAGGVAAGKG